MGRNVIAEGARDTDEHVLDLELDRLLAEALIAPTREHHIRTVRLQRLQPTQLVALPEASAPERDERDALPRDALAIALALVLGVLIGLATATVAYGTLGWPG